LYNFQNSQTQTYVSSGGVATSVSYLGNTPHTRLRGFEFIERWEPPIDGLSFHTTGAYTEARYVSYPLAPAPSDFSYKGGPTTVSLSNSWVTGLPWWSVSVGVNYERPVGVLFSDLGQWAATPLTAFTYGNIDWFDNAQLTSPRSYVQFWQPAYSIVNFGIGLRTDDKRYSLTLWGKNLFNALPFSSWSPGSASAPTTVGISTQGPRFFGATLLVTL
jgi:hypothetical protein